MSQNTEILEQLKKAGIPEEWYILSEVFQDSAFHQILTNQEKNILNTIQGNVAAIKGYSEYVVNIVAKYYAWQLYKDTKLSVLKSAVSDLQSKIESSKKDLESLNEFSKVAQGAVALTAYANIFEERSKTHEENAKNNLKYYIISLIILAIIIGLVFFFNVAEFNLLRKFIAEDIQMTKFSIGVYTLKAVSLLFFFQISQFFRKIYNAEKHLQQVNVHRSDVMQSLHAVYLSIENQEEKDKILSTGALFAFERGESGYISTKEGAGSGDGSIESVMSRILK